MRCAWSFVEASTNFAAEIYPGSRLTGRGAESSFANSHSTALEKRLAEASSSAAIQALKTHKLTL